MKESHDHRIDAAPDRDFKSLYSRFLGADPDRLHFAAHSHHPWPDVTLDAQIEAWNDAARFADLKWDKVFGVVAKEAQGHIARVLDLPAPEQIAFAPNTHEFIVRLLSCFPSGRKIRVVTTDSEFMSFSRQIARTEEAGIAVVERVSAEPFETFVDRFAGATRAAPCDLVFCSQVFFNSGFVVRDLEAIVNAAPESAMVVIDGYHGFFATPTSLRTIADRAFYLAGGYKYAQSGEGVCFLAVPRGFEGRPTNTGWFADFGHLTETPKGGGVAFSNDGHRMMGATFDPTGLYRFNAVSRLFDHPDRTIGAIEAHVRSLQRGFLDGLARTQSAAIRANDLIAPASGVNDLGRFLTFRRDDASEITDRLLARKVVVDSRGDRLRFGFGAYHDADDVQALLARL